MTETRVRSGGRLRWIAPGALVVVAAALWVLFKAYEPFIVAPFGWSAKPDGPYPAASRAVEGWTDEGARADAWLAAAREETGAPAVSAAVSVDGEIVWVGVAGYADLARRVEATPQTVFRIGSSSKPVTSVAMGTLIDAGAVDLDAPVSAYMPDLAQPLATVTTRQAMGHQAGVRDYATCLCLPVIEYFNRTRFTSQRETLRRFERDALLFTPGAGFSYSSNGYNVVGGVIEAVAGRPFAAFLDEAVFAPLGMTASRADSGRPEEHDATFYDTSRPGLYKAVFRVDNTVKLPSGGILSTPSDMVRLGHEMIEPALFGADTRDLLMRPQTLADGAPNPQGYALGWRYGRETSLGEHIVTARLTHNGTALGSASYFNVFPEYGLVVSVMMNTLDAPGNRSIFAIAEELSEMYAQAIADRREAGPDAPAERPAVGSRFAPR